MNNKVQMSFAKKALITLSVLVLGFIGLSNPKENLAGSNSNTKSTYSRVAPRKPTPTPYKPKCKKVGTRWVCEPMKKPPGSL